MDNCATTCQRAPGKQLGATLPDRVIHAAEALACLLTDTPEFQEFVHLTHEVRIDSQVTMLMNRMNGLDLDYDPSLDGEVGVSASEVAFEDLETQLEQLPVVRSYRMAESKIRTIFGLVENGISSTAGVAFAENAKPSACG